MIYNIFCALMLACIPLSADASAYCKVTDARYIHAGQVGADWWAYWWCDDGGIAALSSAPTGSVAVCVRDATR